MTDFEPLDAKNPDSLVLSSPIDGLVYLWCPTMDLIAFTANNGKNVWIHRKNGYRVWDIEVNDGVVKNLVWKPDGKQIALLTTKNQCHIYDSNTSRLLSTVNQANHDISFVHWILSEIEGGSQKFSELVDTDIFRSLPKLPPLPNPTKNNTFSTKIAIEGMIQQPNKSNELDLLLLMSEQKLVITLHGLFTAGPIDLITSLNDEDEEIVGHISQNIQSHFIITSSFSTMKLYLRHFKISFVSDLNYLQDMTLSSSKIIALSGYINEILIFLAQEIKTYIDFNRRFVDILKEELEKINETVGDQLYDLLLTGMMSEELRDWMENTIGERGITRWSKIGDTAFDSTRRTVFYHLVPSCERLIILLTNIKGTASASFSGDQDFNLKLIDSSIESVQNLLKLLFDSIFKVNQEQILFNSFVAWINSVLRELQDEPPNSIFKTSDVSEFINSHLERSSLMMFIPNMRRHFNEIKITTSDLFDSLKGFIEKAIVPDEKKVELGTVTEKQKLVFSNEYLYILTPNNAILSIYRFDTTSNQMVSVDIEMENEISDIQVSEVNDEVYLVCGDDLFSFRFHKLFNQDKSRLKINEVELLKTKCFKTLKPKYLTVNTQRNIGCLISNDMQKYTVFSLNQNNANAKNANENDQLSGMEI